MTVNEIITVVALVAGPIMAVLITRYLDDPRLYKARRMDVFRTLMRTRRNVLSPDHIGALNLVEIEYASDEPVLAAWKLLFTHFGTPQMRRDDEKLDGLPTNLPLLAATRSLKSVCSGAAKPSGLHPVPKTPS